jgi:polysaccharide biosynthesis protein PslJ
MNAIANAPSALASGVRLRVPILSWTRLLAGVVLIILFVPIKRYVVAGNLPFSLEPYRIVLGLVLLGWIGSLFIDRRVRLRRTGFEGPFAVLVLAALASELTNPARVRHLGPEVVKSLTFFATFLLLVYLVVSVLRKPEHIDRLIRVIVGGTAVLSVSAIVEHWTNRNEFGRLAGIIPLLVQPDSNWSLAHDFHGRAYASAQHPIAFGAALVVILPLAIYVAWQTRRRRWLVAALLICLGILASGSRTAIVMVVVVAITYARLRPTETKKLWWALLPLLLLVHFALPSTLGSLRASFFPKHGLIAQQAARAGTRGSGRLADLGPGLTESARHPVFGVGFGTRITDRGPKQNSVILDNQWLSTLLETGYLGLFGWVWLFTRFVRRTFAAARAADPERTWLFAAFSASIAGFAIGMVTYDAFSFIQVTFFGYLVIALGATSLQAQARRDRHRMT